MYLFITISLHFTLNKTRFSAIVIFRTGAEGTKPRVQRSVSTKISNFCSGHIKIRSIHTSTLLKQIKLSKWCDSGPIKHGCPNDISGPNSTPSHDYSANTSACNNFSAKNVSHLPLNILFLQLHDITNSDNTLINKYREVKS